MVGRDFKSLPIFVSRYQLLSVKLLGEESNPHPKTTEWLLIDVFKHAPDVGINKMKEKIHNYHTQ